MNYCWHATTYTAAGKFTTKITIYDVAVLLELCGWLIEADHQPTPNQGDAPCTPS